MHNFSNKYPTTDGKTIHVGFHFNSDLSGDVYIYTNPGNGLEDGKKMHIPGQAILDFVANHIACTRISKLEQMDINSILGLE